MLNFRRCAAGIDARCPLDAAKHMLEKRWLGETFDGVPACCVPRPPAAELMAPCKWMLLAHLPACISRFVQYSQKPQAIADACSRMRIKIVPLIGALPAFRQMRC